MPQMSSAGRILMAAQDMTDALKHAHPDVPFDTIGYDTVTALATLSEIFTGNFTKPEANNVTTACHNFTNKTLSSTKNRNKRQTNI
jgi:hypothetical protein